jgi:hypothetical protein
MTEDARRPSAVPATRERTRALAGAARRLNRDAGSCNEQEGELMAGFDYDVVIIDSGFGGSVAALRAAEKGYRPQPPASRSRPARQELDSSFSSS